MSVAVADIAAAAAAAARTCPQPECPSPTHGVMAKERAVTGPRLGMAMCYDHSCSEKNVLWFLKSFARKKNACVESWQTNVEVAWQSTRGDSRVEMRDTHKCQH